MQTATIASTVRVGNHTLSAEEAAAGVPPRQAFVDGDGAAVDPDEVALALEAPSGAVHTFGYPTAGPTDEGVLAKEETGRFYVDWILPAGEDGVWTWFLAGATTLGTAWSDQDVFYVKRPGGVAILSLVRAVVDAMPVP